MFAASLPISLAGWGIRELSAVLALGTVGVSPSAAILTAVSVGALSLFVLVLLAGLVAPTSSKMLHDRVDHPASPVDYTRWISLGLPFAAATLIFFQLHIPTMAGHVNANLADPLAIIGGSLFAVICFSHKRSWPAWRLSGLNAHLLAATVTIAASLLLGAYRFGWTDWALLNKSLGWFMLLAYAGTGALIVSTAGRAGLSQLLLTFIGAAAAIVLLDLTLFAAREAGLQVSNTLLRRPIAGFAENRNAFAFQLLMVVAASCALANTYRNICTMILGLAFTGLWFAGSRAGWLTAPIVIMCALYLRAISVKQAARALGLAVALVVSIAAIAAIPNGSFGTVLPGSLYDQTSSSERLRSLQGGLSLFMSHPIFGAGLGAYMEKVVLETGVPLVIHSTPLWLLAETGLVGFFVFATLFIRAFFSEITKPAPDLASKLLVLIMVAFAIMSLVHEMLYQRTFWLLLGAGLAYLPALGRESASRAPADIRSQTVKRPVTMRETADSA
jgi:O-antigen ligase